MKEISTQNLNYRPEIDGLRAIAVTSVVLYHAKFDMFGKEWFSGGFIGVDIFFVISGYLITRIILSELKVHGTLSLLNFYERRARRILPMLFFVMLVSMPFAWMRLLPPEFIDYAKSLLASIFFGSNFFFYFSTTEYGATSALLKPFLHTWSLGVEEQFYIIFPLLALVSFKFFRAHFLTVLFGLSLVSLQFAESMEIRNAELNFFLPFSRFWELAAGAVLAFRELNYPAAKDGPEQRILPILGLYMIAYAILFFDDASPHPGFYTLVPVIGVSLVIGFGAKDELVGSALASKPLVMTGLISYSLYLWHFPILAFERVAIAASTNLEKFYLVALAVILSIASFICIERPFRNRTLIKSKVFYALILCQFIFIAGFCWLVIDRDGIPSRQDRVISEATINKEYNLPIVQPAESMDRFDPSSDKKIVLIGDSFADSWGRLGLYLKEEYQVINLQYMGCHLEVGPLIEFDRGKVDSSLFSRCETVRDFFNSAENLKNTHAVILGSFRPFIYGDNPFRFELLNRFVKHSPETEFFIMGNYFQLRRDELVTGCLNIIFQSGDDQADICIEKSIHNTPAIEKQELANKMFDADNLDYHYVSLFELLVNEDGSYPHTHLGVPFMFDEVHLTRSFVDLISQRILNYRGPSGEIHRLSRYLENRIDGAVN